jgi:hypothetical protein
MKIPIGNLSATLKAENTLGPKTYPMNEWYSYPENSRTKPSRFGFLLRFLSRAKLFTND